MHKNLWIFYTSCHYLGTEALLGKRCLFDAPTTRNIQKIIASRLADDNPDGDPAAGSKSKWQGLGIQKVLAFLDSCSELRAISRMAVARKKFQKILSWSWLPTQMCCARFKGEMIGTTSRSVAHGLTSTRRHAFFSARFGCLYRLHLYSSMCSLMPLHNGRVSNCLRHLSILPWALQPRFSSDANFYNAA